MKNNNSKLKNSYFTLLFLVFSFAFCVPVFASVSQLTFTTDPQTIAPGVMSDKLTVSSGEAIGETSDLFFVSSSATGEFSSSNNNWESVPKVTWNSNWANRTFYYRDSTAGTYTITATLTTRTSQQSFTAQQTITVGTGTPLPDDGDNPDHSTTTPPIIPDRSGDSNIPSAHESPAPAGQVVTPEPFKVGAGRPRLASIHSPVTFRAETAGAALSGVRYQWSFGDGGSATGETVNHVYHFPGDYNVVLNATDQNGEPAVSRTSVLIIQPTMVLGTVFSDHVEVINHSGHEINLGGWQISQGAAVFTFPADTIVGAGKNITVPAAYLGFSPAPEKSLTMVFPDQTVALATVTKPSPEKLKELAQTLNRISAKLAAMEISRRLSLPRPVTTIEKVSTTSITSPVGGAPLTASIATISVPKPPGLFARIRNWFGK